MSLKGHAVLLKAASVIWIVGMILGVIILETRGQWDTAIVVVLFAVFIMKVIYEMLLSLIPIKCDQPGCHGRVGHKWVSQGPFHDVVHYVCGDCGHETAAPISFTFGGGNSWD